MKSEARAELQQAEMHAILRSAGRKVMDEGISEKEPKYLTAGLRKHSGTTKMSFINFSLE